MSSRPRRRDDGPVTEVEAAVESGLGDRDVHRHRGVADPDRLAGLEPLPAFALDLLPVEFRTVGAAEILNPIMPVSDRDPRMRPRYPKIRGQIDIYVDTVPRPPENDRLARLIEKFFALPIAVTDTHVAPSGCSHFGQRGSPTKARCNSASRSRAARDSGPLLIERAASSRWSSVE